MPRRKSIGKAGKSPIREADLKRFRAMLEKRRKILTGEFKQLREQTIGKNPANEAGDVSRLPFHIADMGSDVFEHDLNLSIVENTAQELERIQEALDKLDKGTFGRCENCGTWIPLQRLKAIPYARLCIPCQEKEENG